jgi:hypothetical protein
MFPLDENRTTVIHIPVLCVCVCVCVCMRVCVCLSLSLSLSVSVSLSLALALFHLLAVPSRTYMCKPMLVFMIMRRRRSTGNSSSGRSES